MFNDDERWFWHGYDYGWRLMVLGDRSVVSPIDPEGKWYDANLSTESAALWGDPTEVSYAPIPAAVTVREDWRRIRYPCLSTTERELFRESATKLMRGALATMPEGPMKKALTGARKSAAQNSEPAR